MNEQSARFQTCARACSRLNQNSKEEWVRSGIGDKRALLLEKRLDYENISISFVHSSKLIDSPLLRLQVTRRGLPSRMRPFHRLMALAASGLRANEMKAQPLPKLT